MRASPSLALDVRALHKRYGDVVAVNGLDLQVPAGECFGLLGPNGAGKTTTIEICEGLLDPDDGEVLVLGQRWRTDDAALRQRLGVQLQESQFADKLTVGETVRLFRSFYREGPSVEAIIARVQLEEKRNARVNALSGGQKQRLSVACALAGDPDLVFLDEVPTPAGGHDAFGWGRRSEVERRGAEACLRSVVRDRGRSDRGDAMTLYARPGDRLEGTVRDAGTDRVICAPSREPHRPIRAGGYLNRFCGTP